MTKEFIRKKDVYILKNALNSVITEETGKRDGLENILYSKAAESVLNMIEKGVEKVPAADVLPVIHARWTTASGKISRFCSNCYYDEPYKFAADDKNVYDFCPHCGAKMDLNDIEGKK